MEEISENPGVGQCQGTVEASGETKVELDTESQGGSGHREKAEDVSSVDPVPPSNLEVSLERLLQRQRSEILFELRRLQYGERPVTGQEQRRRTVEDLVLRAVGPAVRPGPRSSADQSPANVADRSSSSSAAAAAAAADVSRPEHIIVEVNALVERRPVSSVLNSLQFRRRLENSVRGALQTMRGGVSQGSSTQRTPAVSSNVQSPQAVTDSEVQGSVPEVVRTPSDLSFRSESPQSSASATVAMETVPDVVLQPPVPGHAPETSTGLVRAEEWIQQHVTLQTDPVAGRQRTAIDILDRMHHEEFIVEISDLIHRQLVTSALNGGFRDVLERRMRQHMEASGIDGARVQEQLRQLPRSTVHLRNDFIDLGINPGAAGGVGDAGDAMDDVSVISATAAVALPQAYAQNNVAMNREIQSLRAEIHELKSMMRLSFDLQLDIQRSIRQEVAAALSQTLGGSSSSGPLPPSSTSSSRSAAPSGSGDRCLICDDRQVDTALYQCGHLCLCHACALQLRQNGSNCPVCRAPIRDIMRTYRP